MRNSSAVIESRLNDPARTPAVVRRSGALLVAASLSSLAVACGDPPTRASTDIPEAELFWRTEWNDPIELTEPPPPFQPYADTGVVVFGRPDGTVVALDAATGNVEWRRTFNTDTGASESPIDAGDFSRPAAASGAIIVPMESAAVALERNEGAERWRFQPSEGSAIPNALAAGDGRVFVGGSRGRVFALDAAAGDIIWQMDIVARPFGFDLERGTLYLSALEYADPEARESIENNMIVLALSAADGTIGWRSRIPSDVPTGPMHGGRFVDGIFVTGTGPFQSVYGLDADLGDVSWTGQLSLDLFATGPVILGNLAIFADGTHTVAIDATTAVVAWRLDGFGRLGSFASPASGGGLVYLLSPPLLAVNERGGVEWRRAPSSGDRFVTAAAYSDGAVFIGGLEAVYAIDASLPSD